jgi:hypothetical protein
MELDAKANLLVESRRQWVYTHPVLCAVTTCDATAINTVLQRLNAVIADLFTAGIFGA